MTRDWARGRKAPLSGKRRLVESGRQSAIEYLKWFDAQPSREAIWPKDSAARNGGSPD